MKYSLYCDHHYFSLATEETQEYKEGGMYGGGYTHISMFIYHSCK